MAEVLFEVRDLKRHFPSGKRTVKALDGVSFDLRRGETLSLVGESGCGKTTCARTLLGIYPPTQGTVTWKGWDTAALSRAERTSFRQENQMIFQDAYACLDPRMTVSEIIEEGMRHHFAYSAQARREIVEELLKTVGLTAPCRASEFFRRWEGFVLEESLEEYRSVVDPERLSDSWWEP